MNEKIKVQFGCGNRRFSGWNNFDYEIDINKPLPFNDNSIDIIFTNHNLEHVNFTSAYKFLEECYRILKPKGILRIQVPSIEKIYSCEDQNYIVERGGSLKIAVRNVMLLFGHQSAYTSSLLNYMLKTSGFDSIECEPRKSTNTDIQDAIINNFNSSEIIYDVETIAFEGIKS